jgi:predicted metal-dependent peptidase
MELSEEWKARIREAAKRSSSMNGMPATIRKILEMADHNPVINWRQVLREFIQLVVDSYDFTFTPSDRRFSDGDFILPSFHEIEGEAIENLWMLIDTSGSIDDKLLSDVFCEIKLSLEQFSSVKAKISCFDTKVTEPLECADVEDLKKVKIKGGGGTSFHCIFDYLSNHMNDNMPVAIVIVTDGYASFPDESSSCGIPVLWVLVNNDQDAPWGKSIHVQL